MLYCIVLGEKDDGDHEYVQHTQRIFPSSIFSTRLLEPWVQDQPIQKVNCISCNLKQQKAWSWRLELKRSSQAEEETREHKVLNIPQTHFHRKCLLLHPALDPRLSRPKLKYFLIMPKYITNSNLPPFSQSWTFPNLKFQSDVFFFVSEENIEVR